jgi:hypothetical protein
MCFVMLQSHLVLGTLTLNLFQARHYGLNLHPITIKYNLELNF